MQKLLTALTLAAMLSLTMALSALAAPGGGARVTKQDLDQTSCADFVDSTACFTAAGTINTTTTPSGNESYTIKLTQCSTVTDRATGTVISQVCFSTKGHGLSKDGLLHELGQKSHSFASNGSSCTISFHYHFANGLIQFDRQARACATCDSFAFLLPLHGVQGVL